jgi:hypothetical protein
MGNFRLRVITPCPQASSGLSADLRQRHCASCSLTVHNLSAMTEKEARRLIAGSDGRLCVCYVARPDGTIVNRRGGGWIGRAVRALSTAVLAVAFWGAVVLVQRPWQALARRVMRVQPSVPPTSADGRVSNGLPIDLVGAPDKRFFLETRRDILEQYMATGGIASTADLDLIRLQQPVKKRDGRR